MSGFQPQSFGKYFLVDKIATGGMAEIFKAKTYSHGGFENLLVIKRILPHIGENEDFIEMFIDEAKVSVALQHPNIVRIYDFGKILENYFIAMECVDGKDTRNCLRKLARRRQYMPPQYCAYIAHETCKGLAYAHAKTDLQGNPYGIVHRDISPSNVLVSYEGEIKVADFGIAKAESNAYQTRDGVLKGKFEYMSPEQATGKEIDARSDIFAVGIILYETLTGRRLFKTESEIATLKKIRDCDFDPPSRMNPNIPAELEKITMKALARYPEDRYQSANEMLRALQDFLFPKTADQLRNELATFMGEIFSEEIADERSRLEANSEVAARLHEEAPDTWDGASTMGQNTAVTSTRALMGWGIGVMLVMAGLSAATLGGVYWLVTNMVQQPVEEVATTGSMTILVSPKAKIYVDGELQAHESTLDLAELDPGEHTIRFEEEGYEPHEMTQVVEIGENTRVPWTMVEIKKPEPEPEPVASPAPARPRPRPKPKGDGKLTVVLAGGGWANVYVDGTKLPKTAPLKDYPLSPGNHTVKVENAALGLSHTQSVSVSPGGTVTVKASP